MLNSTSFSIGSPNARLVFSNNCRLINPNPASVRSAFDDVDDYDGWNAKPPQYRDGTVIPDRTDWRQKVSVTYVTPTNPTQTSATDQGAKLIHVTIEYQNVVLADQYAVRTNIDDK